MKEPIIEKIKRYFHGTLLSPHNLKRGANGVVWCSCGYIKKPSEWRNYLPSIRLRLYIPFVRIETMIMYERLETMGIEWYGLDIEVWKWKFNIALYWKPIY